MRSLESRTHKLSNGVELIEHEVYADYYHGYAGEIMEGDGLRLLPAPGRPVPYALTVPLVAAKVEFCGQLVSITLRDRAGVVNEVITGEPACETLQSRVFDLDEPVLVRF